MYPKGLRGFSTSLAHCSGGPSTVDTVGSGAGADVTVTFGALKPGLLVDPGAYGQAGTRTEEAGLYSPSADCTLPGRVAPVVEE